MKLRTLTIAGFVIAPPLLALLAAFLFLLARQGGLAPFRVPTHGSTPVTSPALVARGEYLARIGNCVGCHTTTGGAPLAGGRAFHTEYGTVYSSNLTSDVEHGVGGWSTEEFRHAMRHGVTRNGVMSPVFPYASFQHLADEDLDALLAYLRTSTPSGAARVPNSLEFPANVPGAMATWRLLFFRPDPHDRRGDEPVAQGAYLVEGIGHCATCHGSRGAFGSQDGGRELRGERNAGWFAPSLDAHSLRRFGDGDLAGYLRGDAPNAAGSYGLMADVIARNLQHLTREDALAIEAYLRTLPAPPPKPERAMKVRASEATLRAGRTVYEQHCADCHGAQGEGTPGKYPPLRGSAAIAQEDPVNLIKLVLFGAVAPSTAGQPAPYTMPPLAQSLSAEEVAAVVNFLRVQGNPQNMPIAPEDVSALGGIGRP